MMVVMIMCIYWNITERPSKEADLELIVEKDRYMQQRNDLNTWHS
jgi:hypothetical protein